MAYVISKNLYVPSSPPIPCKRIDGLIQREVYLRGHWRRCIPKTIGPPSISDLEAFLDYLYGPDGGGDFYLPERQYLFRDVNGEVPVTDYGQSVALMEGIRNGFDATQSTSDSRPIYSRMPVGGIRNLLTYTEQFDNSAWTPSSGGTGSNPVVTANAVAAPDGATTADQIVFDTGAGTTNSNQSLIGQPFTALATTSYAGGLWLRGAVGGEQIVLRHAALGDYVLVTLTTEWQRFSHAETSGSAGIKSLSFGIRQSVSGHGVINSTATVYAWGAQIELGSEATPYQRVTSQYDVTEAGVRSVDYLWCDGVDDYMTIPGSASAFKFMHDGTGGTFAGAYSQATSVDTRVLAASRVGGGTVGMRFVTGSALTPLSLQISNGTTTIGNVSFTSGLVLGAPFVARASFITQSGDDLSISLNGDVPVTAEPTGTPSSANSTEAMTLFARGGGAVEHFPGKFFGGLFIDTILTEQQAAAVDRYFAYQSGAEL